MPQELIKGIDSRLWMQDTGRPQGGDGSQPRRLRHHSDQPLTFKGGNMQEENTATERMLETDPVAIVKGRVEDGKEVKVKDVSYEICIDGRKNDESGISVPAGSAGILTVEVNTIEKMTGIELSEEAVGKIVLNSIKENGGSYLHSDMHAAEHMSDEFQRNEAGLSPELIAHLSGPDSAERVVKLVQNPRIVLEELGLADSVGEVEDTVLRLMVENMGCGHLAQMNARSGDYDSGKDTVGKVVRSLLRAKWAGENVIVDFLSGDHSELAMAKYEKEGEITEETKITAVVPLENGQGIFPLHAQMPEYRYRKHFGSIIAILAEEGIATEEITLEKFVAYANALGDKQAGLTMPVLASKLPSKEIPVVSVVESTSGLRQTNLVGTITA